MMQIITRFVGRNKDFKTWLKAGMPQNVVSLAEYRKNKKTASRAARVKSSNPIIA